MITHQMMKDIFEIPEMKSPKFPLDFFNPLKRIRPLKVLTNPANAHLIDAVALRQKENDADLLMGIHRIDPHVEVICDDKLPIEEWSGRWLVQKDRFSTYWDGKGEPPSWAIYFGFVKKEMVPLIYMLDESQLPKSFDHYKPQIYFENKYSFLPEPRIMTALYA